MIQRLSFLIVILLAAAPAASAAPRNTIETLQERLNSIVTVRGQIFDLSTDPDTQVGIDPNTGALVTLNSRRLGYYEKKGAGIIISADGRIVTNTHILYGSQRIMITLRDGSEKEARVLFISPEDDFAIIKIEPDLPLTPIEFTHIEQVRLGDQVSTIGHSDLLKGTFSGGVISGLGTRETDSGPKIELLKLNINHYTGDSGGPVFDRASRLIGLISAKRLTADRQLFAIPAYKIQFADISLDKPPQNQ